MARQLEKTGKTVDEAIWNGVQEMGLSVDEVDIEIIQKGSLGLLGIGAKPAIVRLTEKEHMELDVKSLFEDKKTDSKPRRQQEQPQHKREQHTHHAERKQTSTHINEQKNAEFKCNQEAADCGCIKSNQPTTEIQDSEDEVVETAVQAIDYTVECAQNNEAAVFLTELLRHMDVDAQVLAADVEESLRIKIETEAAGVLIGHRGETLDALQYLTLLVANRNRGQKEYTRVVIDTQGYREKREEVLIRLARSKASTVRASGKPYKFEPMSPYERRIIHSTLQANNHVTTHSEGNEPYRYVVITSNRPQRRPRRTNRPTASAENE